MNYIRLLDTIRQQTIKSICPCKNNFKNRKTTQNYYLIARSLERWNICLSGLLWRAFLRSIPRPTSCFSYFYSWMTSIPFCFYKSILCVIFHLFFYRPTYSATVIVLFWLYSNVNFLWPRNMPIIFYCLKKYWFLLFLFSYFSKS